MLFCRRTRKVCIFESRKEFSIWSEIPFINPDHMGRIYNAEEAARRIEELENENLLLKARIEFLGIFNESSSSWDIFRDKNGRLFFISALFEKISGYSRNDFLSGEKELISIAHPGDIEILKKMYQQQSSAKPIENFEFRLLTRNNEIRYLIADSRPVFDNTGEFIGTRVSCQDITKLKQTEDALKESEVKLKIIFHNSNDGIILIDEEGRIVDWNERVEKLTGLANAEAVNNYVWDIQYRLIAQEQKKLLSVDFLRQAWIKEVFTLKLDESTTGFGEIVSIGGKVEHIEDLVKPVMIGDKRFYCIFQHYLTEEKRNERLLLESEEKFEKVFNMSPVPIALLRCRDMVFAEINEAFRKLTGYSSEELLGHTSVQIGLVPDSEERDATLNKMEIEKEAVGIPYKGLSKSGKIFNVYVSVSVIQIQHEDYYLTILYDVSELMQSWK